jgi:hypothetical protein
MNRSALAVLAGAALLAAHPLRAQEPAQPPAPAAPAPDLAAYAQAGWTWTMPDTAGARRVRVSGWVVDSKTGAPLPGARVGIPRLRKQAVAGPRGEFVLEGVPPGPWPVMLRHLGYRAEVMLVPVDSAANELTLALRQDAVILDGLAVVSDRFAGRRRAAARSVRLLTAAQLAGAAGTAREVVMRRLALVEVPCESVLGQPILSAGPCVRIRGFAASPSVWIDERPSPGGLDGLEMYDGSELAMVESYAGGGMIRVYTPAFLERAARTGYVPEPFF